MSTVANPTLADPRWVKLHGVGVDCSCGVHHVGLLPLHMIKPMEWDSAPVVEPDSSLRMDGDFMSADFFVREGKYFGARMRMPVQIKHIQGRVLMFTVWTSLNRSDFEAYVSALRTRSLKKDERAPAWLVNRIGGYPDTGRMAGVSYQQLDGPPIFMTLPKQGEDGADHQLTIDQRDGVTLDRLFDIYAAHGHDMRPSFS